MEDISKPFKKLKRRIKKFVSHPLSLRKDNTIYLHFNKSYKKFDWSKKRYTRNEVKSIVDDDLFRDLDSILKNTNHFDTEKIDNTIYISRESLEEEFLKREMCSYFDGKMWKRHINHRKKIKFKCGRTKEYYIKKVGRKFYMGKLPVKMDKKIKIIKEYLLNHKEIFNRKSDIYLNPKVIRNMISRKMLYGSEKKFDIYLSECYNEKSRS